jgi:hypothetical protein
MGVNDDMSMFKYKGTAIDFRETDSLHYAFLKRLLVYITLKQVNLELVLERLLEMSNMQ